MSTVIIFNPNAGRGQALNRLRRLPLERLGKYELWASSQAGHAKDLALRAAEQGIETVVAAGGDGTVHEVANGILRAGRGATSLAIIPIGSANDYFHGILVEASYSDGSDVLTVDVGRVRGGGRERYFVCALGLGFNGAVTLESRKIRGLQGIPLYGLATLRALTRHYRIVPMRIAIDDRPALMLPTLMLSVLVARREGSFLMAPRARLGDGLLDYVHAGQLSRWEVVALLPRIALYGAPEHYPQVETGQCRHMALASPSDLIVHADGEFFCTPPDRVRDLEIEVLPGRLRVRLLSLEA